MTAAEKEVLFTQAMAQFYKEGVKNLTEQKVISQFNLNTDIFPKVFRDKEDFLRQAVEYTLESQKNQEAELVRQVANSLEEINPLKEIILVFRYNVKQLLNIHPAYFIQIQYLYPQVWKAYTRHAQLHGYYQFYHLINKSIQKHLIRHDVNIEIVTKVLIEQINVMHNTHLFPRHRYNMNEVFRNVFSYYMKGICTEDGYVVAEQVFAEMSFERD